MDFFKGKKTYILALVAVIYAVSAAVLGKLTPQEAFTYIWTALTASALRNGMQP